MDANPVIKSDRTSFDFFCTYVAYVAHLNSVILIASSMSDS